MIFVICWLIYIGGCIGCYYIHPLMLVVALISYHYLHNVKEYHSKSKKIIDFFTKYEDGEITRMVDSSNRNRVYIHEPHGPWCTGFIWVYLFDPNCVCLVSKHLLKVPILGFLARLLGCKSATKQNIKYLLQNNITFAIIPSGARGMELTAENPYIKREGIFKLIHDCGTDETRVVTSISLNEDLMYYNKPLLPACVRNITHKIFGYPGPFLLWGRKSCPLLPKQPYTVIQGGVFTSKDCESPQKIYDNIDEILLGTNHLLSAE